MRTRDVIAASALAGALLLACGSPSGPRGPLGRYRLDSINGYGTPYREWTWPGGNYNVITDGFIELRVAADSTLVFQQSGYSADVNNVVTAIYRDTTASTFSLRSDTIRFALNGTPLFATMKAGVITFQETVAPPAGGTELWTLRYRK